MRRLGRLLLVLGLGVQVHRIGRGLIVVIHQRSDVDLTDLLGFAFDAVCAPVGVRFTQATDPLFIGNLSVRVHRSAPCEVARAANPLGWRRCAVARPAATPGYA